MIDPQHTRRDPLMPWTVRVRLDPTQNGPHTLIARLIRGARMFKSKPIGWITALTLLAVAGISLACRLKDGGGQAALGDPPVADAAKAAPLPEPLAPPVSEASVPAPAGLNPDREKPVETAKSTLPPPPPETVIPPPPLNAKLDPIPKEEVPIPLSEPKPTETVKLPTIAVPPDVKPAPVETVPPITPKIVESAPPPVPEVVKGTGSVPPTPPTENAFRNLKEGDTAWASSAVPKVGEKVEPAKVVTAPPMTTDAQIKAGVPSVPLVPAELKEKTKVEVPVPMITPAIPDKNYWAVSGESLRDIARKTLGSEDRWREIGKLNPELRSRTLIPAGTMVRLPSDAQSTGIRQVSGSVDSDPLTRSSVKPVPVIRAKPDEHTTGMAMMGTFECKLDAKGCGCLMLPKDVCEQLGKCETMLLTPGPDNCLWLVSQDGAAHMLHRIEKAHVGDAEVQAFKRLYFSQTRKTTLDAGCLKMPEELAGFASLTGNVVLIGMDDHFEVWDAARWQRYSQQKSHSGE